MTLVGTPSVNSSEIFSGLTGQLSSNIVNVPDGLLTISVSNAVGSTVIVIRSPFLKGREK